MASSPDNSFDPQDRLEGSEPPHDSAAPEDVPADSSAETPTAEGEASPPSTKGESTSEEKPASTRKPKKARGPVEETPAEEDSSESDEHRKDWYILKVQSNREKSICSNLMRRVKMAGLEDYFGEVLVPTEDLVEYKNGKKKVTKQKLYPGYIVVNMAINDDTWFLVRETAGIGDFTGAGGKPVPMLPQEVDRILKKSRKPEEGQQEEVKTNIRFKIGEHVRITEGTFENFEGDVELIDETNGRVTVMINIFGRTTPVEMEHWQMEPV